MSRFTRSAPWLRHLFTPSQTESPNPGRLSDDVSLVQMYDGGGFSIPAVESWGASADSAVGASTTTDIVTAAADPPEIVRVYSVGVRQLAGAGAPEVIFQVQVAGTSITPNVSSVILLTGQAQVPPNWIQNLILGPGSILQGFLFNGDAATTARYTAYILRLPLGAVPGL